MPGWIANMFTGDMTPSERQAVVRSVFASVVLVHIAWACGFFPGASGFAIAEDIEPLVEKKIVNVVQPLQAKIQEVESKVTRIEAEVIAARIEQLERSLFELRKSQCAAMKSENREAIEFYQRRMDSQQRAYLAATGTRYAIPSCAEVGE